MTASTLQLANAVLCAVLLALVLTNVILLVRARRVLRDLNLIADKLTVFADEASSEALPAQGAEVVKLIREHDDRRRSVSRPAFPPLAEGRARRERQQAFSDRFPEEGSRSVEWIGAAYPDLNSSVIDLAFQQIDGQRLPRIRIGAAHAGLLRDALSALLLRHQVAVSRTSPPIPSSPQAVGG